MKRARAASEDCPATPVKRIRADTSASLSSVAQPPVAQPLAPLLTDRVLDWIRTVPASPPPEAAAAAAAVTADVNTDTATMVSSTSSGASSAASCLSPMNYRAQVVHKIGICFAAAQGALDLPLDRDDEGAVAVADELCAAAAAALDRATTMEPEWTDIWYAALKELVGRFGELKCQKARDWQAALKPILYTHRYPAAPQKRPQAENMAPPADPVLEQAPSSLQPRTPRPDIAVGLDAARLGPLDSILKELQEAPPDSGFTYLLSDPCTTAPSGMRFPFFVAELRSSGRAMIEAENRVAVGGSCALSILRSLENGAAADGEDSGLRTYSLTTEGIYASLWQHCYTSEDPQSQQISITPLGLYRVSDRNDSTRLIRDLAAIFAWGAGDFKTRVTRRAYGLVGLDVPSSPSPPTHVPSSHLRLPRLTGVGCMACFDRTSSPAAALS